MTDGGSLSTTVTVDVQLELLPAPSVAVAVTFVTPASNSEPEGMLVVADRGPEQLSVAVAANVAGAWQVPGTTFTTMGAKHVIAGAVSSTTVTVPVAWLAAPFVSVAVRSTVVVPSGYGPAGDCVIVNRSPSASDDPSSIDALALHVLFADTVTSFAFATGTWFGVAHAALPMHVPDTVSRYSVFEMVVGTSSTMTAKFCAPPGTSSPYVRTVELAPASAL